MRYQRMRPGFWILAGVVAAFSACKKDDPWPPVAGRCGLTGQQVYCNKDSDCLLYGAHNVTCNEWGYCFHAGLNEYKYCSPGQTCLIPPDTICNQMGECSVPCETHSDCPHGECMCDEGPSLCVRWYCQDDGTCPYWTTPLDGTLICEWLPDLLQGDCHNYSTAIECPEGYVRVGEYGCKKEQ